VVLGGLGDRCSNHHGHCCITIRSSRTCFVTAKAWQKKLATLLLHYASRLNSGVSPHLAVLPRDVEASFTFLCAADGGRSLPLYADRNYRPQFHYNGTDWDVALIAPPGTVIQPGDTVIAHLAFLSPAQHWGKLAVGSPFLLREGPRIVAYGSITALLDLHVSAAQARAAGAV
jgi:hypothetical protein